MRKKDDGFGRINFCESLCKVGAFAGKAMSRLVVDARKDEAIIPSVLNRHMLVAQDTDAEPSDLFAP